MKINVAIIEDEGPFRASLAALLSCDADLECLGAYASAEQGLKYVASHEPDVLLLDLHLPRMSGVECARRLKNELPALKILILTKYEDPDHIFQALEAGADGYLLKRKAAGGLCNAIKDVYLGGGPMSSEVANRVVGFFHSRGQKAPDLAKLSPREYQVLHGLAQGFAYKEIAEQLGLSRQTINDYIKALYQKLHVHSRSEAAAKYFRR